MASGVTAQNIYVDGGFNTCAMSAEDMEDNDTKDNDTKA
jgi:enoyl-[acyl-carrier protein] reductase I